MAKIEYNAGSECLCCGNLTRYIDGQSMLCQKCGAQHFKMDRTTGKMVPCNTKTVSIKVTHGLFHKKYEKVSDLS